MPRSTSPFALPFSSRVLLSVVLSTLLFAATSSAQPCVSSTTIDPAGPLVTFVTSETVRIDGRQLLPAGDQFVVTWRETDRVTADTRYFVRWIAANGTPTGDAIELTTPGALSVSDTWLSANPSGTLVAAWDETRMSGPRLVVASISTAGSIEVVHTDETGDPDSRQVEVAPNGRFHLHWERDSSPPLREEVRALFEADGTLVTEYFVSTIVDNGESLSGTRAFALPDSSFALFHSFMKSPMSTASLSHLSPTGVPSAAESLPSEGFVVPALAAVPGQGHSTYYFDGFSGSFFSAHFDTEGSLLTTRDYPFAVTDSVSVWASARDDRPPTVGLVDLEWVTFTLDGEPTFFDVLDSFPPGISTVTMAKLPDEDLWMAGYSRRTATEDTLFVQQLGYSLFSDGFETGDLTCWSSSAPF